MLAWLRTGIAVMAFGFVVARFGLFLRLLHAQAGREVGHGVGPFSGPRSSPWGWLPPAAERFSISAMFGRYRTALARQPPAPASSWG